MLRYLLTSARNQRPMCDSTTVAYLSTAYSTNGSEDSYRYLQAMTNPKDNVGFVRDPGKVSHNHTSRQRKEQFPGSSADGEMGPHVPISRKPGISSVQAL